MLKKKRQFLYFLLIIAVLFLTSIVAIVISSKAQDNNIVKDLQSIPPKQEWSLYNSNELGISFLYPPEWKVDEYDNSRANLTVLRVNSNIHTNESPIIIEAGTDKFWKKHQIENLAKNDGLNSEQIKVNDTTMTHYFVTDKDGRKISRIYTHQNMSFALKITTYNHFNIDHSKSLVTELDKILVTIINTIKIK